jgi:serine/threonine protein phosphatase PrpC
MESSTFEKAGGAKESKESDVKHEPSHSVAPPPPLPMLKLKLKEKPLDAVIGNFSKEELKIGNAVYSSLCGSRRDQEDRACGGEFSSPIGLVKVACVIDGHGGDLTAEFVRKNFLEISSKTFENLDCIENVQKNIEAAFVCTHRLLKEKYPNTDSGACVLASFEIDGKWIALASSGDCRSLQIKKDGTFCIMTPEHKASDKDERKRIENAGMFVEAGRVNGILAVSRSIGDFDFQGRAPEKQEEESDDCKFEEKFHAVSCMPDVLVYSLENTDAILLYTDGVYESLTSEHIAEMFKTSKDSLEELCSRIVFNAVEFGSTDNVTFAAIKY